jgi:hypothetical protein
MAKDTFSGSFDSSSVPFRSFGVAQDDRGREYGEGIMTTWRE